MGDTYPDIGAIWAMCAGPPIVLPKAVLPKAEAGRLMRAWAMPDEHIRIATRKKKKKENEQTQATKQTIRG